MKMFLLWRGTNLSATFVRIYNPREIVRIQKSFDEIKVRQNTYLTVRADFWAGGSISQMKWKALFEFLAEMWFLLKGTGMMNETLEDSITSRPAP